MSQGQGNESTESFVTMLDGRDHRKASYMGRAIVNLLDAFCPNADTDSTERAILLTVATILQRAVYRRFNVQSIQMAPFEVPDRPPAPDGT